MATSVQRPKTSIADFEAFVARPENSEQLFEFIGGEIVEMPSNPFVSDVAGLILFFIRLFLRENKLEGHVTGADGGYIINGDVYAPDVAYISVAKQAQLTQKGFGTVPPEIAVEVISDPNNPAEHIALRRKLASYLAAGIVVWIVDPFAQMIEVYVRGQAIQVYTQADTLPGGEVLPSFTLPLQELFPNDNSEDDETNAEASDDPAEDTTP